MLEAANENDGDTVWWCESAWLGGGDALPGVVLHVADGRFTRVVRGWGR